MESLFIKAKRKLNLTSTELLMFLFIIVLSIFFQTYHLERFYQMNWDQERDANVVWEILKNRNLTLIGPRAVGPNGFFLGPLWYYLLAPFYFFAGMDPIAAPIFGVAVGVMTTTVAFIFTQKIFNPKLAIIAGLLWATQGSRTIWNPILVPLITLFIIFALYKTLSGDKKFIIWSFLLIGLSLQIHFQAVFFAVPIFIALLALFLQKKFFVKEIVCGLLILVATFAPLIIFDFRNNFINTNSFLAFFSGSEKNFNIAHSFTIYLKNIVNNFPLPFQANQEVYVLLLIISILGIFLGKTKKDFKIILLSILIFPPVFFSFYRGNLSEYYFSLCLVPLIFGLSFLIKTVFYFSFGGKLLALLILFLLLIQRLEALSDTYEQRSLYYKRQAVKMITDQGIDPIFNVSYSTPYNEDTGFRYLFKYYGREPKDIPEGHLWTIAIPANSENVEPLATFGDIGVIRR